MTFVDELYEHYKNVLTADDEDVDILVATLLNEFTKEDMLDVLTELNSRELLQLTGMYLSNELKKRIAIDRANEMKGDGDPEFYH